ncbi:uncharacterized protein si:zfos-464b6.2 isoform X2 [Acanthopagrus latus]|uniref:uncharacterized protein si:zfos-464b6.2 isoform X2 n=1 Tax=Acanthopagrus latus TaxID=8177 RepID=UPI00187C0750|nr:uncharacterized protein si:zfos-464b6.2 isoform X2 [Acanthopagrus latus]
MSALLLKKFRWLRYICPVVIIVTLILLLWTLRSRPYQTFRIPAHSNQPRNPVRPPKPVRCGPAQTGSQVPLVAVKETKTILVSAFQEHRTEKKMVRVIAVVLRSETVAYRCVFCCMGQQHISEGFRNVHGDHFGFAYGTADIMCPLPSSCDSPSHVTVTSAADSQEKLDKVYLEVKNKKTESESFHYSFTVCISTMFDFNNMLQLVQSFETLQLLGVDRVVVYKTSSSPETQRILDYYTQKGLVEVIPWTLSRFLNMSRSWLPEHGPGEIHYFGQIPVLHDCLYRYMYQSRYVALHDIDELILPHWSELLPLLENKYDRPCFMFENNVFPNTVKVTHLNSDWQKVPGVNILTHLYQEPVSSDYSNFKTIVNPRAVFSLTVHGLLDPDTLQVCSWVERNIARMYHTRHPRQPELTQKELIYDDRLLKYGARFTQSVNTVLSECGLLQKDGVQ